MRHLRILALVLLCATPLAAQNTDLSAAIAAAEAGDTQAQVALGAAYHNGEGVVQSYAEAARWYALAAEAGDASAQNALGRYLHAGLGVQEDRQAALTWLRAAADQGAPQHIFDLATMLEQTQPSDAAALYRVAAESGLVEAVVSLGVLYQKGTGVRQDLEEAFDLYTRAAEVGHPRAQNNLGLLYVRGDGVAQDYERAAELFAAAANQGLRPAMVNLGVMYQNGLGVPVDEAEGDRLVKLGSGAEEVDSSPATGFVYDARLRPVEQETRDALQVAAEAGDPVAEFQLAWLLVTAEGAGFPEWQQAATLFHAAAGKGHAPSMVNLGHLYAAGLGVPQDYVLAQMWLLLAASRGFESAAQPIATLEARMTTEQIDAAQARASKLQKELLGQPWLEH